MIMKMDKIVLKSLWARPHVTPWGLVHKDFITKALPSQDTMTLQWPWTQTDAKFLPWPYLGKMHKETYGNMQTIARHYNVQ